MALICVVYDWCLFQPDPLGSLQHRETERCSNDPNYTHKSSTTVNKSTCRDEWDQRAGRASYFCQFPVINEILNPARLLSRLVSVYYKQQCSGPGDTPTLKPESDPLLILLPDPCVGAESSVQTLLFSKILSLQRKHNQ